MEMKTYFMKNVFITSSPYTGVRKALFLLFVHTTNAGTIEKLFLLKICACTTVGMDYAVYYHKCKILDYQYWSNFFNKFETFIYVILLIIT